MDIITFLRGIESLRDFQRISELPCFSSNVHFDESIPILMRNIFCFDFKDGLLSKKIPQMSIELFKIILTNIKDFEIEQNNMEMLQLFKYILKQTDNFNILPNPNVARRLLWGVLEEIIPIISETVSRSPSLRQGVVHHLRDRFLGMILSSPPFSVAQISFLVNHLNACLQSLPSPPKIEPYQSSKLGALMCSCGDYPLQLRLMELHAFLKLRPILPPGRVYSHVPSNITEDNFDEDCRRFLNDVNSLELRVISFQCSELAIGRIVISGPLWVDWNLGSFTVSWACEAAALGLFSSYLEPLSLRLEEVRHINYRKLRMTLDGAPVSAISPEASALLETMPPRVVLTFLEKRGPRLLKILKLLRDGMPPQVKLNQDHIRESPQPNFQLPASAEAEDLSFSANRSSSQGLHSPPPVMSKLMKDLHILKSDVKYRPEVSAIHETSITETDLSVENLIRDLDVIPATPPVPGYQRRRVTETGRLEISTVQRKVSVVKMKIRTTPGAHVADSDEYNTVTSRIPILKKRRYLPTNTKPVDSTPSMIGMKDFAQTDLLKDLNNVDQIQNLKFQDVSGELKKIDIKENEESSIRNKLPSIKKISNLPIKFSRTNTLDVKARFPESTSLVKQMTVDIDKPLDDSSQKEKDVQPIPIPLNNLENGNNQPTCIDLCGTDPAPIHPKSTQKVKGTKKPISITKVLSVKGSANMKQIVHSDLSQESSTTNNLESHPVDIEKKIHTAESSSQESSKRKKLDNQSSSSQRTTRSTKNKKKINLHLKAKLKSKVEVEPKLLKINPVIGKDRVAIENDLADSDSPKLEKDRAAQELCIALSLAKRDISCSPTPRQTVLDKSSPQDILMEDNPKNVKEVEFKVPQNNNNVSCGILDAETIRRMNSSGSESDIYIPASPRKTPPSAEMAVTPAASRNKIDDLSVKKVPVSNEGATNPRKRNIKQVKTLKQNQNCVAKKASRKFKNRSPNRKLDCSVGDNLINDSHIKSPERVLLPNDANVTKRRKLYSAKYDDPDLSMYQCPSEEETPPPLLQGGKTKGVAVAVSPVVQTHSAANFSYRRSKDQPTPSEIRISETFDSLKAMGPTYPREAESLHDQYTFPDIDSDTSVKPSILPKTKSQKQKKPIAKAKVDSKKIMKLPTTRKPKRKLTNEITSEISDKTLKNIVGNNTSLTDEVVTCDPRNNANIEKDNVPSKYVFIDLTEDDEPSGKKPIAKAKVDSKKIIPIKKKPKSKVGSKKIMKLSVTGKPKRELINKIIDEISSTTNRARNNTSLADEVVRCNSRNNSNLMKDEECKDIFIDLSEDDVPLANLPQLEMVHPDCPADIPKVKKNLTKQTNSDLINVAKEKNKKNAKSNKKITGDKSSPTLDTSLPSLMVENLPILQYNDSFEGANIMERIINNYPLMDISNNTLPLEIDKEEAEKSPQLSHCSVLLVDLALENKAEMDRQKHISDSDSMVLKHTPTIHNDVQLSENEMSDDDVSLKQIHKCTVDMMKNNMCMMKLSLQNSRVELPLMHSSQSTSSCQTDSTLHSEDIAMMTVDKEPILHQIEKEPTKILQKLPIFDFDPRKYVSEVSQASTPKLIYRGSEIDSLQYKPKKLQGVSKGINSEAFKQYQMSSLESIGTSSKSPLMIPVSSKRMEDRKTTKEMAASLLQMKKDLTLLHLRQMKLVEQHYEMVIQLSKEL